MALAILDLVGIDDANVRFRIDTGTNRYYQVMLGEEVRSNDGFDWIDGVVYSTPVSVNPDGGGLLDTATEVAVPAQRLERGRAYAQLFSFKTREGRSMAFSGVLSLDRAMAIPELLAMQTTIESTFQPPRSVPCRTAAEQFSAPAIGDLLSEVVRLAAPLVTKLLGSAAPAAPAAQTDPLAGLLATLLRAFGAGTSTVQSLSGNRFTNGRALARPFIFGIDDALLGAVIGQVIGVLPELVNSANQTRVQLQQGHNTLAGDAVSEVQRRMMLDQVLAAQGEAQETDLAKLTLLLQQAAAAAPATATPATTQSLPAPDAIPSARAVATFLTAPPVPFGGRDQVLFARGVAIQLAVRFTVGEPVPATPLPNAIVRVVLKRPADQQVLAEKSVRQTDLAANATVPVAFTAAELAAVPAGEPLSLLAEIRWPGSGGTRTALGSTDVVFVDRYFVQARGAEVGPEVELTDMARFRPFWNKLWESPALDAVSEGPRRLLWELDANLKYSVLVVGDQPSNGVMETRALEAEQQYEGVADRTEGRMKGGIELSVAELAKLAPLWEGEAVLDADRLAAFTTPEPARTSGGEVVHRVLLKGRAAERGLVWVVPVFALVAFTLGAVQATDGSGQVTAVTEEQARLPLPSAVRILGLKTGEPEEEPEEPAYRFEGYAIDVSEKVALLRG